eukprot:11175155-Lingulodinium_polyedra.AAC.1
MLSARGDSKIALEFRISQAMALFYADTSLRSQRLSMSERLGRYAASAPACLFSGPRPGRSPRRWW